MVSSVNMSGSIGLARRVGIGYTTHSLQNFDLKLGKLAAGEALNFNNVLSVIGLAIGIVGVALSVFSYQKMRTAREAEKDIERKFMHYSATQEFEKLAVEATAIMDKVARREWGPATEQAHGISSALAQARGARMRLLEPLEKDKLDGAGIDLQHFMASLPLPGQNVEVPVEQIQVMLSQCVTLANIASELAGRLRVESIVRPEEKK
jgi:hypothetical protein